MAEQPQLSATAKVILGMLARLPRSGYEIKQAVEWTTRFFWAASYGQIYPELKRLEADGLIEGSSEPTGGRPRVVYRLTGKGRDALRAWLRSEPGVMELRHEGLLMTFFADALPASERHSRLLAWRRMHLELIEALREVEATIPDADISDSRYVVLRYGIESNQWAADWCERMAAEIEKENAR